MTKARSGEIALDFVNGRTITVARKGPDDEAKLKNTIKKDVEKCQGGSDRIKVRRNMQYLIADVPVVCRSGVNRRKLCQGLG